MTPETAEHLHQAHQCLSRARTILAAGVGEDAGRNAYLAASHSAQALIAERVGKAAKTHRGVHRLFADLATSNPDLADLSVFSRRLTT